jgi:hypothetical protein
MTTKNKQQQSKNKEGEGKISSSKQATVAENKQQQTNFQVVVFRAGKVNG